jgi:F-box protein 9
MSTPGIPQEEASTGVAKKVTFQDDDPKEEASTKRDEQDDESEPKELIWFQEDEGWELTWPIWHFLSRDERRDLAHKHGYKTIGEFEEFMALQRAVGDSNLQQRPYDNSLIYPVEEKSAKEVAHEDSKPASTEKGKDDEDDDDDEEESSKLEAKMELERLAAMNKLPTDALLATGGQILMLPDELLHRVFAFLPVDHYAVLALVSPHWKSFTRTEAAYKHLCERLYLQQSKRRALHVSRFGNSYRTMLEKRPRVRAGGGAYIIKYAKIKPIQRDMFTQVCISRRVLLVLQDGLLRCFWLSPSFFLLRLLTSKPPIL